LGADPARKPLLDQIMYAATRDEIGAAIQAQLAWLRANPDDFGMLQAGEDLAYAFDRLCLKLLLTMGYEFLPPTGEAGEDSLLRRKDEPPGQRIAFDCIWTYVPASVDSVWALDRMMRDLRATEGLLITGAGLDVEASQLTQRLGIQVIDGDELKRLIDTYAPELNEPTEPVDDLTALEAFLRVETESPTQGRKPAEPTRRQ
jgi:hypothetical protein